MRKAFLALALASACRSSEAPSSSASLPPVPPVLSLPVAYFPRCEVDEDGDVCDHRDALIHRDDLRQIEEYAPEARRYAQSLSFFRRRRLLRKVAEYERQAVDLRKELDEIERKLPARLRVASMSQRYIETPGDGDGRVELDVVYKDGHKETLDWNEVSRTR